jgi:hypothetical protein
MLGKVHSSPFFSTATPAKSRAMRLRTAVAVLAAVYMLAFATYFAQRPSYGWDMLAYMAIALRDSGTPVAQIHDETYRALEASRPPPDELDELKGRGKIDPAFRQTVAADSNSFLEQLPFYSVKPLYPELMAAVHRAGLGLVASGLAVSAAVYFGIGMLLYAWFSRWMAPFVAFGIMALLVLDPLLVLMARNVGPDLLSVFALLAGAYLAIERDRPLASAVAFIASIAIRPENILYAGVFLLYLGWLGKLAPLRLILCLAAAGVLYVGVIQSSGNYGWTTLFYYSFINKTAAPADARPHMELIDYARMYIGRIDRIIFGRGELPIFVLIGFGALFLKARLDPMRDRYVHLIVIAAVLAAIRMIVMPTEAYRALLPSYMYVTVAFVLACIQLRAHTGASAQTNADQVRSRA